jgi:hypothetical protein
MAVHITAINFVISYPFCQRAWPPSMILAIGPVVGKPQQFAQRLPFRMSLR